LTFNSLTDVQSKVGNAGRTDAKKITIKALFLDNNGARKKVELVVRVQNAPVGCSVRKVDDPGKTNPVINGWLTFMCYNLGADPDYGDPIAQKAYVPYPNNSGSTDRTVYGDVYQWGRIDDGHQRRDLTPENIWPSDHFGQTTGFANNPVPNAPANIDMKGEKPSYQVLETDVRFGKFIRRNVSSYDWIAGTGTDEGIYDDRWNIGSEETPVKAPADPCPAGWRVPTRTEWASIYGTTTDCTTGDCLGNAKVNQWVYNFADFAASPAGDPGTRGISLTPSGTAGNTTYGADPTLFLPAGADRDHDHAAVNGVGGASICWSSSVVASGVHAYTLAWSSTLVYLNRKTPRATGNLVRCVSE
jgi:uncharacterized protein (TIGR02145 family)